MSDDLMAVQVEVDPILGASSFRAAEKLAIETPCLGKIVDREGQMKWRQRHALLVRAGRNAVQTFVAVPLSASQSTA